MAGVEEVVKKVLIIGFCLLIAALAVDVGVAFFRLESPFVGDVP